MARNQDEDVEHTHEGGDRPHTHERMEEHTHGVGSGTSARGEAMRGASTRETGGETIRLREEELQAQKRPVETGAVGIRKEVVEEQRTMDVPVTREEAVIERHPVERRPSDEPIGEGGTVRVPLREEQVEVEKRPVVTEEVSLGKRAVQDTEQVSGTVRREEARIEQKGDVEVDR